MWHRLEGFPSAWGVQRSKLVPEDRSCIVDPTAQGDVKQFWGTLPVEPDQGKDTCVKDKTKMSTNPLQVPEPHDRNFPSDERLVVAVLRIWLEDGMAVLVEGISKQRLAARAGQSRQTLHQRFPSREALKRAAVSYALSPTRSQQTIDFIVSGIHEFIDGTIPTDSIHLVRSLAEADFDHVANDEFTELQMLLWGAGQRDPQVLDALAGTYGAYTRELVKAYDDLLRHWRRTLRYPFTTERLAIVLGALVEGMAIRGRVDDRSNKELFGDVVLVLLQALLVPDGTLDGGTSAPIPTSPPRDESTSRRRIIDTTVLQFQQRGSGHTTLAQVAAAAGVSEQTIRNHFGGLSGVVVEAFSELIPRLTAGMQKDAGLSDSPLDRVRRHLTRLTELALENYELTSAFISLVQQATELATTEGDPRVDVPLPDLLEPLLLMAQDAGAIRDDMPPRLLARSLNNIMFLTILTTGRRSDVAVSEQAHELVDFVWSLTFEGLAV